METQLTRYVPITKIDDDERMVFGWASTPELDSDGEVITVKALEKALPDYMKFPTIREMHQPRVAGTTKNAEINANGLYIGAKIISDEAWKMVKGGGYRGFSVGGNVVLRTGNVINELDLVEISLVDVPANKGARIEVWKKEKDTELTTAKAIAESLGKISFEANTHAELLRKGVKIAMDEKVKELEKKEEVKTPDVEEVKEETPATPSGDVETESTESEDKLAEGEKSEGDTPEEKAEKTTIEKMVEIDATLETIVKKQDVVVVEQDDEVAKSVSVMADTITKMTKTISDLNERIAKLEAQPAPLKSHAVFVEKKDISVNKVEDKKPNTTELDTLGKRRGELSSILEKLGANEFAKQGFSKEAMDVESKMEKLLSK